MSVPVNVNSHKENYFKLLHDKTILGAGDGAIIVDKFLGLPSFYQKNTSNAKLFTGCVIDLETTGLDTTSCEIIDIAFRLFEFDEAGNIYSIGEHYQCFNEPSMPLSEDVKRVTGYNDEMLKGHKIDWAVVDSMLAKVDLAIAYNASFDRPVAERYSDVFKDMNWACAMKEINWEGSFGVSGKLEWLGYKLAGMYYEAHQALADVDFTLHMLTIKDSKGIPVMAELFKNAITPNFTIRAVGAPFDQKDNLRARGYRWNPGSPTVVKSWEISVPASQYEAEIEVLKTSMRCFKPVSIEMTAKDRFSVRG